MGVRNHFPVQTWGLRSLDETKFNGKMSIAYLYIIIGWISGELICLYDKFKSIILFCFSLFYFYILNC